jgi:hypothetical protein
MATLRCVCVFFFFFNFTMQSEALGLMQLAAATFCNRFVAFHIKKNIYDESTSEHTVISVLCLQCTGTRRQHPD